MKIFKKWGWVLMVCLSFLLLHFDIVMSGSMESKIHTGSLAIVYKNAENIEVNDIILYKHNGINVLHRVVEVKEGSYITKGDANSTSDENPVSQEQVIGKYLFSIPCLGYFLFYIKRYLLVFILIILGGNMMMNLKQNKTKALCAIAALGLFTSAAYSYFTDKDEKTNTFTIGSVDIDLIEPNWPGDDPVDESEKDLVPNEVVAKDPTVTNKGKNDAYVYLEITVPKDQVVTANDDGTKNKKANLPLFVYSINDGWTQLNDYTVDKEDSVTYVYAYNSILKAGEKTNALFDEVTFINVIEGEVTMTQNIDVVAKAIQSQGTGTVTEAYVKLQNQLA